MTETFRSLPVVPRPGVSQKPFPKDAPDLPPSRSKSTPTFLPVLWKFPCLFHVRLVLLLQPCFHTPYPDGSRQTRSCLRPLNSSLLLWSPVIPDPDPSLLHSTFSLRHCTKVVTKTPLLRGRRVSPEGTLSGTRTDRPRRPDGQTFPTVP